MSLRTRRIEQSRRDSGDRFRDALDGGRSEGLRLELSRLGPLRGTRARTRGASFDVRVESDAPLRNPPASHPPPPVNPPPADPPPSPPPPPPVQAAKHPAYLHALSDLREARFNLARKGGDAEMKWDEREAIEAIDKAISEIKRAAI